MSNLLNLANQVNSIKEEIRQAIIAKGVNVLTTDPFSVYPTKIASIDGTTHRYALLERVTDDNNIEIGTVSGFFTDENDVEYAVVLLDARYRLASGIWCSSTTAVTNMPMYSNWNIWTSTETATTNTQYILDFCTANNYTSSACEHCRTLSFVVDGVTYYGQLPNIIELNDICRKYSTLNNKDGSDSSYSSLLLSSKNTWSSSQCSATYGWYASSNGGMYSNTKPNSYFVAPVLEIPNT